MKAIIGVINVLLFYYSCMQNRHLIIKSIQDLQLGPTLFAAALFSPLIIRAPFLELLFSSVCDVQCSEHIFKTNVVSLSILQDEMKRHSLEWFSMKAVLLVPTLFGDSECSKQLCQFSCHHHTRLSRCLHKEMVCNVGPRMHFYAVFIFPHPSTQSFPPFIK